MSIYGDTLIRFLRDAYPDHEWLPWLFKKSPSSDWSLSKGLTEAQAKRFADYVMAEFKFDSMEDWYRISVSQLQSIAWFPPRPGFLLKLLTKAYPSHTWEPNRFNMITKKAQQRALLSAVKAIFGGREIFEDYKDSATKGLELDIYIPSLNIGVELQGVQHFKDVSRVGQATPDVDDLKAAECSRLGITLLHVPYSWNGDASWIRSALSAVRPDLKLAS
eukprot:TRINITY_DN2631_c0_g1_i2.p2 TRINITY_DN2631_c0_g1~~TRINITY_DN2631_c0_g1_i2.p2  ORF type:complete len:219 (-),score=30.34 TRINITY_DN2631_c0_g1_i2:50-706(-)